MIWLCISTVRHNNKNSKFDNKEQTYRLENKESDKINIDYISGLIDEEVAILKDEIENKIIFLFHLL